MDWKTTARPERGTRRAFRGAVTRVSVLRTRVLPYFIGSSGSEQPPLILIPPRHRVTAPAPRLVALVSADHDRRRVVARGTAVDQSLVAARRVAAHHADRVELVHHLGHREELRHAAEWLAAEVGVGAGEDHASTGPRERGGQVDDAGLEELRLVDRDHLGVGV